jgi:hypothetical protein
VTLRIRAVRLHVVTDEVTLGRTVLLSDGLTVIRGANSRGKTQVVQAIIYALGLERMLSTRASQPLGSALTSEVLVPEKGGEVPRPVRSSWVAVEVENERGQVVTAQRFVRSDRYRPDLVRVWSGPVLTQAESAVEYADYFLNLSGAAVRDHGFHSLLTRILGWSLPEVANYSGTQTLLYLDVIFPFLIIDQQGWSSAGPRKVDRYQIREPVQRAAEFLLRLAGPASRMQKAVLEQEMAELRTAWASARASLNAVAGAVGGRVQGVPDAARALRAARREAPSTELDEAGLVVLQGSEWVDVQGVIQGISLELSDLAALGTRVTRPNAPEAVIAELSEARSELADVTAAATLVEQDVSLNEAQLGALDSRIAALGEELNRNKDVRTLARLGSEVAAQHLAEHNCPTCHQDLQAAEAIGLGPTLDVEETVALFNAQLHTAQRMRERVVESVTQGNNAFAALQREADQVRVRVRALETDVLAPAGSLTESDIATKVTLQLRQDELGRARDTFVGLLEDLRGLDARVVATRNALTLLPEGGSPEDAARLEAVASVMRSRLRAMNFRSYPVDQVRIDPEALRPSREGFDIDVDVSASDVIRVKVAYLDSLREIGAYEGNHPGLLILDEPRQQDLAEGDFHEMLRLLSRQFAPTGQVIVTSATPLDELIAALEGVRVTFVDLMDDRLLQVLDDADPLDPDD